ncbi:MAG: Hsp20/alpha crystallin family protein [Candidatus Sericytochromatia bacterium]
MFWNLTPVFDEMDTLRREMDALFDRTHRNLTGNTASQFPAINLYQDPEQVHVLAELPGVRKEDLELHFADGTLTLKGQRQPFQTEAPLVQLRNERRLGNFEKSLRIPIEIDADGIQAELKEGLLQVKLPKAARAKTRQIAIQ